MSTMKLISTVYPADELEVLLTVQSRTVRSTKDTSSGSDLLITRYRSKIGNESLIFNPSIGLILRSRNNRNVSDALISINLIYRFTASLSTVYQKLQSEKLYHSEGNTLYVDQKLALHYSRKISLFRNSLTICPAVSTDRTGKLIKGVIFTIEGNPIGTMNHSEVLGLLDILDHLDISTYALMAGVVDEMENMGRQMNMVMEKLTNIEKLLIAMNNGTAMNQSQTSNPGLKWENIDTGLF